MCKDLGIKGMYKGSTITLLRDVPYSMIFFPLNATMQNWFMDEHGNIPLGGLLTAGMVAGCFAAGLMTPMDVIKTRVQAEKGNKLEVKFFDMFKKIFKTEGIKGLYKGAVPRMCVQAPCSPLLAPLSSFRRDILPTDSSSPSTKSALVTRVFIRCNRNYVLFDCLLATTWREQISPLCEETWRISCPSSQ